MAQHDLAIRQLKEIGGRHGYLTLEQIKNVLPVDEMTPEEIGRAVMQIEEAGVEVRLDEEFLRPRPGPRDEDGLPALTLSDDAAAERAPPLPLGKQPAAPTTPRDAAVGGQAPGHDQDRRATVRPTLAIVVLLLAAVGAILLYALVS